MSQYYDAGPGDRSDREWEVADKPPLPHARRRRGPTLPPWALLVILVGIIILLCLSLVLVIRALRKRGSAATPTVSPTATLAVAPTNTIPLAVTPTEAAMPTATVTLPVNVPGPTPTTPAGIAPGVMVVVRGTQGVGLNIREQPTTYAKILSHAKEGTVLKVLDGPRESDGYVWWKVQTPDGIEGWGAENWLALK